MTTSIQHESFIRDISVTPTAAIMGSAINKPPARYSVTCTLKQTIFSAISSYDEHGKPTKPSLLFIAQESQPKQSNPMSFVPSCKLSLNIMRARLWAFLQHATNKVNEDAVIEKILQDIKLNDGYNNIHPRSNYNTNGQQQQEVWPEVTRLDVTINVASVNHVCVPPESRRSLKQPRVDEWCPICMEAMMDGDNKQELTSLCCDHVFHQSCIIKWLATSASRNTALSCPLCRKSVPFR